MQPQRVHSMPERITAITLMLNAHENATLLPAQLARLRAELHAMSGLPVWVRLGLMDGSLYVFLPGAIVVYDYYEFLQYNHPRRNGKG